MATPDQLETQVQHEGCPACYGRLCICLFSLAIAQA